MSRLPNLDQLVDDIKGRAAELEKNAQDEARPKVQLQSKLAFTQKMLKLAQELRELDPGTVTLEDVQGFANELQRARNGQ